MFCHVHQIISIAHIQSIKNPQVLKSEAQFMVFKKYAKHPH